MTPRQRFFQKFIVNEVTGCWLWTASKTMQVKRNNVISYGAFSYKGKCFRAHRWSFVHIGKKKIPKGYQIDHLCNHGLCVNPEHLRACTARDNTFAAHSLNPARIRAQQTHCKRGHPLSGKNLGRSSSGHRRCKKCQKAEYLRHKKGIKLGTGSGFKAQK